MYTVQVGNHTHYPTEPIHSFHPLISPSRLIHASHTLISSTLEQDLTGRFETAAQPTATPHPSMGVASLTEAAAASVPKNKEAMTALNGRYDRGPLGSVGFR